jgi:hypothetical protein
MFIKIMLIFSAWGLAGGLAYLIVKRLTPVVIVGGRPVKQISVMTWAILMTVIVYLIFLILSYAGIEI